MAEHQFRGRREDMRLITGRGHYTADHSGERPAAAYFLRSDRAHAKIGHEFAERIDTLRPLAPGRCYPVDRTRCHRPFRQQPLKASVGERVAHNEFGQNGETCAGDQRWHHGVAIVHAQRS